MARLLPPPVPARRQVTFGDTTLDTPVYDRSTLGAGFALVGPALVEEAASVTVIGPAQQLTVSPTGHLVISAAGETQ